MTTIILDGKKVMIKEQTETITEVQAELEQLPFDNETLIQQPTELGETLKHLNDDSIQPKTRMSAIDLKANLHPFEERGCLALDSLVALRVLPPISLSFSRQKKRLSVSRLGRGRDDIVKISSGQRDHQEQVAGGGIGDKIKAFMGVNK